MKNKKVLLVTVLLFSVLSSAVLFGQSLPIELGVALTNGNVTLSATGNGSCAGISIEGRLTNNLSVEISINVNLSGGMYLANSGSGQNMLATRIFLSTPDGLSYSEIGTSRFITLAPKATVGIAFEAYCADFDKDNPTRNENLSFRVVPQANLTIASKISRYVSLNFDVDLDEIMDAIQVALWRAEGKSREEIAGKYTFTSIDWELSTEILNF